MKSELPLIHYRNRDEYYAAVGERPFPTKDCYIDSDAYKKFSGYFKNLGFWDI